jgi:hypothetical protein
MKTLRSVAALAGPMREAGPYAAIALIVPGGSLIALGMWAFRHRAWAARHLGRVAVIVAAMAAALAFPHGA